jgi:hypothetical protein
MTAPSSIVHASQQGAHGTAQMAAAPTTSANANDTPTGRMSAAALGLSSACIGERVTQD